MTKCVETTFVLALQLVGYLAIALLPSFVESCCKENGGRFMEFQLEHNHVAVVANVNI